LKGRVFSGKGSGARFVNLPWVRKQLEEKLGFSVYSGTLNIRLTAESANVKRTLTKAPGIEIVPALGYYPGKLFRANLMDLECAVVIPEVPGYKENVLEVISSVNLRDRFNLVNGSMCDVEVMF
jgi:CTP-dependent riboflavin kinase